MQQRQREGNTRLADHGPDGAPAFVKGIEHAAYGLDYAHHSMIVQAGRLKTRIISGSIIEKFEC
jgi:hypothetical protein